MNYFCLRNNRKGYSLQYFNSFLFCLFQDALKALMRLSQQLAHDIPQKSDGDVTHSWAIEEDLVNVIQVSNENIICFNSFQINLLCVNSSFIFLF